MKHSERMHVRLTTLLLLAVIMIGLTSALQARTDKLIRPTEVIIVSPDKLEIVGYFYLPTKEVNPHPSMVVLIHEMGKSHEAWDDFPQKLCDLGYAVLNVDLRGHGQSVYDHNTNSNRPQNNFYEGDFE